MWRAVWSGEVRRPVVISFLAGWGPVRLPDSITVQASNSNKQRRLRGLWAERCLLRELCCLTVLVALLCSDRLSWCSLLLVDEIIDSLQNSLCGASIDPLPITCAASTDKRPSTTADPATQRQADRASPSPSPSSTSNSPASPKMSNRDCFDSSCYTPHPLSTGAKIGLGFGLAAMILLSLSLAIPYGRIQWQEWQQVEMQLPAYSRDPKHRRSLRDGVGRRLMRFCRWRLQMWRLPAVDDELLRDPRLRPRPDTRRMGVGSEERGVAPQSRGR